MTEVLLALQELACTIATQEGLNADLWLRQVFEESSWVVEAVNKTTGCSGLTGLHPNYWRGFIAQHGKGLVPDFYLARVDHSAWPWQRVYEFIMNPRNNLVIGAREMAFLLRYWQTYDKALACYNHGWGRVAALIDLYPRDWQAHLPLETRLYIARILLHVDARKERGIA